MKKGTLGLLALSLLSACGGNSTPTAPPVTQPPAPSANVAATGAGVLVLHPSINPAFVIAMETPIRITETSGGSADWNFARMAIFLNGVEIERSELGANALQAAGFGRIGANSNRIYNVIFRFNSTDFDRIDFTLGFGDVKDGRQFTVFVPLNSFTDVDVNLTPLSLRYSRLPM